MNFSTSRILAALLLCGCLTHLPAQEWTRFRGPNGTGISDAQTIPSHWTAADFNWKIPLPGPGHSSPVLWGEKIFLITGDETANQVVLLCFIAPDGRELWRRNFPVARYHKNALNTLASGTPAVDAQRVYACWAEPAHFTVAAFDHQGKQVWIKDLGPFTSQHGGGASPIVYQGLVIVADQQDGESFLVALDAASGEIRWKTPRKTAEANYSTPCLYEPAGGRPELIFTSHSHGISAVDPGNGKVLWELGGLFDKRVVSSPVIAAGLIIGACGSGEGGNYLVAVRPANPEKNVRPELAYKITRSAPYVPTSICVGPLLFLWGDRGVVTCLNAASGEVRWQERIGKTFFGSPVCVGGRLFCASHNGEVVVIAASEKFALLARNPLGEITHSTPAVAGGRMYIHTTKHLISIGGAQKRREETKP